MSRNIANYKIPCQDSQYCSFSSFLMIMVALLRRSSVSILFLLTNVPLRCLQQCWFRDSVKYSGSVDSSKAIKGRRRASLWLSGTTLTSWELSRLTSMQVSWTGKLQNICANVLFYIFKVLYWGISKKMCILHFADTCLVFDCSLLAWYSCFVMLNNSTWKCSYYGIGFNKPNDLILKWM